MFDVFEAFLNTDNIQVFANAATSYIMCLMKFVKGLGEWSPPFMPVTAGDSFLFGFVWKALETGPLSILGWKQMVCTRKQRAHWESSLGFCPRLTFFIVLME